MSLRIFSLLAIIVLSMSFAVYGANDLEGTFTANGEPVPFRHVYALLHDNNEGVLSSPTQLRLLLTDVEVPVDSLYGLYFLPIGDLGREGKAKVLLLQFDPANYSEVDMMVLLPNGLQTVTTRLKITDLKMIDGKVSGAFEYADVSPFTSSEIPSFKFNYRFSADLNSPPPVTADLKGRAVLSSPQLKLLRSFAKALSTGDLRNLRALSSERAFRKAQDDHARLGAAARKFYIRTGAKLTKLAPTAKRVVVRGNSAVVIFPDKSTFNLVLENGVWKGN